MNLFLFYILYFLLFVLQGLCLFVKNDIVFIVLFFLFRALPLQLPLFRWFDAVLYQQIEEAFHIIVVAFQPVQTSLKSRRYSVQARHQVRKRGKNVLRVLQRLLLLLFLLHLL